MNEQCIGEHQEYENQFEKDSAGAYEGCTCTSCRELRTTMHQSLGLKGGDGPRSIPNATDHDIRIIDEIPPMPTRKDPLTGTDFPYVPGDPFW